MLGKEKYIPEQYSMDKVTVEPIVTVNSETIPFKRLSWPLELQGRGESNSQDGSILVRFPKGDVFLSFVTTIHELGHPKQIDDNPKLKEGDIDGGPDVFAEEDVWQRGLERFSKANPDTVAELEKKFTNHRRTGQLQNFISFKELYAFVRDSSLKLVRAQREMFERTGKLPSEFSEQEWDEVAKQGALQEFLKKYETARVNEMVDEVEMCTAINKTIKSII